MGLGVANRIVPANRITSANRVVFCNRILKLTGEGTVGDIGVSPPGDTFIISYTQLETFLVAEGETYTRFEAYLVANSLTYTDFEVGTITEENLGSWFTANP